MDTPHVPTFIAANLLIESMTSPFISLYYASAGGFLMAAAYSAVLTRSGPYARTCRMFAVICMWFLVFQIANAAQYESQELKDLILAHKWVNASQLVILGIFGWFLDLLTQQKRFDWLSHVLAGGAVLALALNFSEPYGYRFVDISGDYRVQMAWGEMMSILSGTRSSAIWLVVLLYSLLMFKIGGSIRFARLRQQSKITRYTLAIGTALLLPSLVVSALSDAGTIHWPYMGGFCLMLLTSLFAFQAGRLQKVEYSRLTLAHLRLPSPVQSYSDMFGMQEHGNECESLVTKAALLNRLHACASQPVAVMALRVEDWQSLTAMRGVLYRDRVEVAVGKQLLSCLGNADTLARLGSNLYALIFPGIATQGVASAAFYRLCAAFEAPLRLPERSFQVQLAAGIVIQETGQRMGPEQLLEAAEFALQEANQTDSPSPHFYHLRLGESWRQKLEYADALAAALHNNEFTLHFQPQMECAGGRPVAIEALVRWQHPVRGMIPPQQFIPLAEATGLIDKIGAWVIEHGIRQLAGIQRDSGLALRLAINVSPKQLLSRELERHLAQCLERYGVGASAIELEVTESVIMDMPNVVIDHLQGLRDMGVRLAIDDFGTGYSSLSYLQRLPVHVLKLDRSFVRDLSNNPKSLSICKNTIRMARELSLEIVAEGVETAEQAVELRRMGCDMLQG